MSCWHCSSELLAAIKRSSEKEGREDTGRESSSSLNPLSVVGLERREEKWREDVEEERECEGEEGMREGILSSAH